MSKTLAYYRHRKSLIRQEQLGYTHSLRTLVKHFMPNKKSISTPEKLDKQPVFYQDPNKVKIERIDMHKDITERMSKKKRHDQQMQVLQRI